MRPARPEDVPHIAALQANAWAQRYAVTMPSHVLPRGTDLEPGWSNLLAAAPDSHDTVLVAYEESAIVGVVADAPATDPDLTTEGWREIAELAVEPAHANSGHGSRLLAAWADVARTDGHAGAVLWVAADDDALRALATSAGFAPDGAHRTLDLHGDGAVMVRMVRLATTL